MSTTDDRPRRPPLTRRRILQAGVDLADREGLDALTMRRLGAELGVEAMSLYKHVTNKDDILDGIVETVIAEIEIPSDGVDWQEAMSRRATSARRVLARHSWAIGLLETRRSIGPITMRYLDAILGSLRSAGFSVEDAAHAFWLLDSYVYGQVIQETSLPFTTSAEMTQSEESGLEQMMTGDYPNLIELGQHAQRSDYSVDHEFEFGLALILDALERMAA